MRKTLRLPDHPSILEEIQALIWKGNRFLLTTHIHPDGDALASVLLFGELLRFFEKAYEIVLDDEIPSKYQFLPGIESIVPFAPTLEGRDVGESVVVVLDAACLDRLGRVAGLLRPDAEIVNIDHHPSNTRFGRLCWIDTPSSSTVEIVYTLCRHCGMPMDARLATLVYAGIVSDTGGFRFNNTNPEALETAAEMIRLGADPSEIVRLLYHRYSLETVRALGVALERTRFYLDRRAVGTYLTQAEHRRFPGIDTEGFVNYLLMVDGPQIQFFIHEVEPGRHRVSLRSRTVDVNRVAQDFGGGGHSSAAGFDLQGSLESVERRVVAHLGKALERENHP